MWRVVVWDRVPSRRDTLLRALAAVDRNPLMAHDFEALLSAANDAATDLVVIVDPDADFVRSWKEAAAQRRAKLLALIDLSRPQAVWFAMLLKADRVASLDRPAAETTEIAQALLSKAAPAEDGIDNHLASAYAYQRVPDDLFAVVRGVCQEVTGLQRRFEAELAERRRVEQALMESEAFYQSLVATLPLAMFRKDLQGRITFANKVLCEAMRRPAAQIIGRSDYDFFPKELADHYRADDRRVMESGRNLETDEEFLTPSGERRILHSIKAPVYDASGQLIGIQGIFSDITDQRRAELALEQERARLDSLIHSVPDYIWFKDTHSRYLRVNPALAMAWHLADPQEAIGLTDFDVFSAEFARQLQAQDQQVLTTGRPMIGFEEQMLLSDGRTQWISTTKLPLTDASGHRIGTFGIARDISQIKQTQQALRKAKEAAEAANRAKSDFLANMSHEIRTPLNAVIGMTDLLLEHENSATQREYLRMVHDAGETLLALVEDILDFSKVEAGKLRLEEIAFSLRDEVGNAMKSLALRAHNKRLELACHVAREVPDDLEGDPNRLRQILFNLVGNAVKFTERGEVVLDVTLDKQVDQEVDLHFVVRDTGIGVPADKIETIFQPFEQADSSTTRRYGGTGLGLGIASRLIELMHGRIWVESLENLGSHFHFTAKFHLNDGAASADPPLPRSLEFLKILVVDDNATSRNILVEMLESWGLKTIVASGTAEALVTLQSLVESGDPCGMVLVDAQMPGEDGFQLAARLSQQPHLCPTIVMMLNAGDRADDIVRCQRLGVAGYVMKPVKQSELLEAVVAATTEIEETPTPPPAAKKPSRPLKILLAEDSPMNQKLAVGLLERWGHEVTVADNGHIAVVLAREQRFDVVLMDVQMPEMDGLEATRVIRREEPAFGNPRVPIVAMTAHAMPGDRERCLAAGMDDYVRKPIRADALFRALEDATTPINPELLADAEDDPNETASSIDLATARAAVNDDEALLRDVMEAFLTEAPDTLQRLETAGTLGRWTDARRLAHTLKGALLTFGADAAADRARVLELAAKSSNPTFDPVEFTEFSRETTAVLAELRRYLNSAPNGGTMTRSR